MAEYKDYSGMFDWKDSVVTLNALAQRMLWPFVPVMPVDKRGLALIEKAFLESQQRMLEGLVEAIQCQLEDVEEDEDDASAGPKPRPRRAKRR